MEQPNFMYLCRLRDKNDKIVHDSWSHTHNYIVYVQSYYVCIHRLSLCSGADLTLVKCAKEANDYSVKSNCDFACHLRGLC